MKVKKIWPAVAVATLLMLSCNKKHAEHIRVLKSIVECVSEEEYTLEFTYDENGRIILADGEQYLYPTYDSVYILKNNGDTVYCHLNAQGYIDNYTIDGNMCKICYDSEGHYMGDFEKESAKWYNDNLVKVQYGSYYTDLTYTNIENECSSFDVNYIGMTECLGLMGTEELSTLKWFGFLGKGCKYLRATEADAYRKYTFSYKLDDAGYVTELAIQSDGKHDYKLLFTWSDIILEVE